MSERKRLRGRLHLEKDGTPFLSGGRIDLLEAIDRHGSITHAARAVGLSYKGAWDAVDSMNNQADQPIVIRTPGGRQGGGTRLTDYGRRILALVRGIENEYHQALGLLDERSADHAEYRQLLRRFSLRTSARNLLAGTIETIAADRVRTRVTMALDPQTTLTAHVSTESARRLGLEPGLGVFALVKAVGIAIGPGERAAGSDATEINLLRGRVVRCTREAAQIDLSIELPGGKTLAALVPDGPALADIDEGSAVTARIDPNSVVLVMI